MEKILQKAKILFIPCEENRHRPRFLKSEFLFYYIVGLLVLKLIAVSFVAYFPKTVFFADLTKTTLIQLTNQERQAMGLTTLKENPELDQAAQQKAQDMLAQDYFSHWSPTGVSPWYWFKEAGYSYQLAGENLAIGFLDSEEVVNAWLNSPSHRANLVNSGFQETGMAVLKGDFQGSETTVVVQLFGSPIQKVVEKVLPEKQEKITITKPEIKEEILPEKITEEQKNSEEPVTEKEVVAGASEVQLTASQPETAAQKEKLSLSLFKFLSLNYPNILEKIIFYSLLLITIALILNVFIKIHIQDGRLILKTVIFITLLVLFVLSNKEVIVQLIPHNLLI